MPVSIKRKYALIVSNACCARRKNKPMSASLLLMTGNQPEKNYD
jgi:hypothetical protein